MLGPWKKSYGQIDSILKSRDIILPTKVCVVKQSSGFSSSHVWIWELDHKKSWALKNWCFWTVVLEKTLESPLDCKEIQPVHPKGDQSWVFIGRTDAEAETPILWPPDRKNWFICKDSNAGKDWRWEGEWQRMRWLDGLTDSLDMSLSKPRGVGDGQACLARCSPWGRKESDPTEWLKGAEAASHSPADSPRSTDILRLQALGPCGLHVSGSTGRSCLNFNKSLPSLRPRPLKPGAPTSRRQSREWARKADSHRCYAARGLQGRRHRWDPQRPAATPRAAPQDAFQRLLSFCTLHLM